MSEFQGFEVFCIFDPSLFAQEFFQCEWSRGWAGIVNFRDCYAMDSGCTCCTTLFNPDMNEMSLFPSWSWTHVNESLSRTAGSPNILSWFWPVAILNLKRRVISALPGYTLTPVMVLSLTESSSIAFTGWKKRSVKWLFELEGLFPYTVIIERTIKPTSWICRNEDTCMPGKLRS